MSTKKRRKMRTWAHRGIEGAVGEEMGADGVTVFRGSPRPQGFQAVGDLVVMPYRLLRHIVAIGDLAPGELRELPEQETTECPPQSPGS